MFRIGWIFIIMSIMLNAEKFVLVTHADSPINTLTQAQVRMIYLKKKRFWGEIKLVALNLPPQDLLRKTFENEILKMNSTQLDSYWIKQHYRGYRPPYRVESIESMILFIKKVEGAIGYIPVSKVDKDLKVIYRDGEL
ncbi:MAG: hypothetical protein WBM70_10295 [Sulfurovum sp.]|uniref:hypothetical protein n=1 Tax=Sulfurovum sp. TaxID=1969726 RepID=UPI003C707C6D